MPLSHIHPVVQMSFLLATEFYQGQLYHVAQGQLPPCHSPTY